MAPESLCGRRAGGDGAARRSAAASRTGFGPRIAAHQLRPAPVPAWFGPRSTCHHGFGDRHGHAQRARALQHRVGAEHALGDVAELGAGSPPAPGPRASSRPTWRLRDRSPVAVSTRSPRPDRPMKVSARAPSATPSRVISARPRVISAARAFGQRRHRARRRRDAHGDRQHVLHRAAHLDTDHVVGGVDAQRCRCAGPARSPRAATRRRWRRRVRWAGRAPPRSRSSGPTARPRAACGLHGARHLVAEAAAAVLEALAQPQHAGRVEPGTGMRRSISASAGHRRGDDRQPAARMRHRGVEVGRRSAARAAASPRRGSARCAASPRICAACAASRAHRRSGAALQALTASAVPQAPAPSTVRFIAPRRSAGQCRRW